MTNLELETDLEGIVIGTVLVDNRCIDFVFSNLKTDDFNKPENQILFNSFLRLYTSARKIDLLTVIQDIKDNAEKIEPTYLIDLSNRVATSTNIETHVEMLKNQSVKRHLVLFAQKIYSNIISENVTASGILSEFINEATTLQNRTTIQKATTFKDQFQTTVKKCLDSEGKPMLGLRSGFSYLDSRTSGFSAPDLTIIAAGPGEGKSTFALNIAKHISMNDGDVLYFSYEMKEEQLIYKLISDDLNISVLDVRLGHFKSDYVQKNKLHLAKLHIYDKGGLSIDDIIGISKMQAKKLDLKIIIIDYLQLIRLGSYIRKVANKNDEVTIISNKLKQLAMELNLPILALSQLNRDKTRKRYTKADLRDSGAIEQDADNIIFIFRPSEHDMTEYSIGNSIVNCDEKTAIINIDKWRLGRTGEFEMVFNGECSRFEDKTKEIESINVFAEITPNKSVDIPF